MGEGAQLGTTLREPTARGSATVLVEANDRLQEVRSMLATVLTRSPEPADGQSQGRQGTQG